MKGFFSEVLSLRYFDLFSAVALALVPHLKLNLWAFVSLFLLGLLRSYEGIYPYYFFGLLYVLLFGLWHYARRYFKEERRFFRLLYWSLGLFVLLFSELLFLFQRLALHNLNYTFWLTLLLKTLLYGIICLILIHAVYFIITRVFEYEVQ
ncbi:MAG: hypothetical protein N2Z40_05515 [Caldimicrobium sp.]|nr:hypothetical protein [Caldimicrobium sp.]